MITGISARLLLLTILVVMVVEVVIFVPSVAQYRKNFLEERLVRAEIAALTVMAAPSGQADEALQRELLDTADALNIVVAKEGRRIMALAGGRFSPPVASFDLRDVSSVELIGDALNILFFSRGDDVHRVIGNTGQGMYDRVEITFVVAELRSAMVEYGLRILQLSLVISIITASVVFITVRHFVVAPLLGVIRDVERFHEDPEDPSRVMQPRGRVGEVAQAEQAIAAMQADVRAALGQRRRLAALGEAVAKINHDLRNMLSAGQLMTERLGASEDPLVARVLPKLVGSLDRAVSLCQSTLDYGRAEERDPVIRPVDLAHTIGEVVEGLGLPTPDETAPMEALRSTLQSDEQGQGTPHPSLAAGSALRTSPVSPRVPEPGAPAQAADQPAPQADPQAAPQAAPNKTRPLTVAAPQAAPNKTRPLTVAADSADLAAQGPLRRVLTGGPVRIIAEVPPGTTALADAEFLYRVLTNLLRNAVEAIRSAEGRGEIRMTLATADTNPAPDPATEALERAVDDHDAPTHSKRDEDPSVPNASQAIAPSPPGAPAASAPSRWTLPVSPSRDAPGERAGAREASNEAPLLLLISDTGPGLPERTRRHLFQPFQGSTRRGGTGLGLAIAAELASAQGGALSLYETSPAGTVFALALTRVATAKTRAAPLQAPLAIPPTVS
ncbi:MAG: ATP-binding protein [Pseudomonadota bacterium]